MALVKVQRAGTVLFVDEKKLDFYIEHGYGVVTPDTTPEQLTPPLYDEDTKSIEPALIKVQIVPQEDDTEAPTPEPPKTKTKRKKKTP